ncbi:hypothetical protein M3J09_005003 [Ascochyta lentis]
MNSFNDGWSTSSTPNLIRSLPRQSPVTTPSQITPSGTSPYGRRPNPKLIRVRRTQAPSALQVDDRYDSIMDFGGNPQQLVHQAMPRFPELNCEGVRSSSGLHEDGLNPAHGQAAFTSTRPAMSKRDLPSFAVQHCIRLPDHSAEANYRFPSSQMLRLEGIPCSSSPCSALGTPTGSLKDSSFSTPDSSAANSKTSSLRNFTNSDEMNVDTDSDAGSGPTASLKTHASGTNMSCLRVEYPQTLSRPQTSSSCLPTQAHIMSNVRTGLPIWNHSVACASLSILHVEFV